MIKKNIKVLLGIMLMVIVPSTSFICLAQNNIPPRQEIINLTNEEQKIQTERAEEKLKNTNTSKCNGIKLNTNFPGIGKCIQYNKDGTNPTNVFKITMTTLTKFVMSIILVICFILIIVAGIMRAGDKPKEGRELIKKVAITILLLGFSGVILRLINPNFFG